ncbi:hypothetical protein P885DRAFT_72757 [Corynascus similis CBS 632.67]
MGRAMTKMLTTSLFKDDLLCHSGNFPGAKESGKGKRAMVVGACNSSMDICQDYVEKGYDMTMVQRSSTYVISSENAVKVALGVPYKENSPLVEDSDLVIDITTTSVERDKEMLHRLEKAGFKIDKGLSNRGLFLKYLWRGGDHLQADKIVFATRYDNMRTTAKEILGDELPDKMRTIWTSGHPGLWFHGGNLALCRYNSRLVALQILAKLKGLEA